MTREPEEWIETNHAVRPATVARLERALGRMAINSNREPAKGSISLSLGSCQFDRDDQGVWTRETRRRNPAWLNTFYAGVIADAGAKGCPVLVYRYSRREPWRKRILPALRALCRLYHGKTLQADGIVLEGFDGQWEKTRFPRYEFDRETGKFQAVA